MIAKAKWRLEKHFAQEPNWELDKEQIQRLQREIEQAEIYLEETECDIEDWHHGDIF